MESSASLTLPVNFGECSVLVTRCCDFPEGSVGLGGSLGAFSSAVGARPTSARRRQHYSANLRCREMYSRLRKNSEKKDTLVNRGPDAVRLRWQEV